MSSATDNTEDEIVVGSVLLTGDTLASNGPGYFANGWKYRRHTATTAK